MTDTPPSDARALAKAERLERVTKAAKAVRRCQERLAEATAARDEAILTAQGFGATYPELAEAAGLTRDRISQVLQAARRRKAS